MNGVKGRGKGGRRGCGLVHASGCVELEWLED